MSLRQEASSNNWCTCNLIPRARSWHCSRLRRLVSQSVSRGTHQRRVKKRNINMHAANTDPRDINNRGKTPRARGNMQKLVGGPKYLQLLQSLTQSLSLLPSINAQGPAIYELRRVSEPKRSVTTACCFPRPFLLQISLTPKPGYG